MSLTSKLTEAQKVAILSDKSGLDHVHPDPEEDSTWIGAYRLGGGSFGEVTTWICVDRATHRPIKSVAIKDSFDKGPTEEKGAYSNVYNSLVAKGLDFGADPSAALGKANIDKRFSKEAYLQGIMTEPSSNQEIYSVPLLGYRRRLDSVRPGYNHWRLYMPLYEYGDLFELIVAHRARGRGIPEPFIWHTLRCLLTGAEQLTEQVRKRQGSKEKDVIVVFDMKPDNILLAPPDQTSTFPIYPRAHIADLGGGFITNPNDIDNMTGTVKGAVTTGYRPPEIIKPSVFQNGRFAIGEWTNIWQIGRVIEAMMKLATFNDLTYRGNDLEPQIVTWQGHFPGQFYSPHLKSAVAACLRLRPDQRATARALLNIIDNNSGWRLYLRDMHTFGSDAWFEEQERRQQQQQAAQAATAAPATAAPPTSADVAAEQDASSKKRKRMEDANYYLRAWGRDKAAKFDELGVLPNEQYDLEYPDHNVFWAKDDFSFIYSDGKPVYPLAYQPEGHTASIGFGNLAIASPTPAGQRDHDVQDGHGGPGADHSDSDEPPWFLHQPDSIDVDEGGEEDDNGEDSEDSEDGGVAFSYHSSAFPALAIPPQRDDDSSRSSDVPWLIGADDLVEDDEQSEDDDEQAEDDEEEEDDDDEEEDDNSAYYTASSDPRPTQLPHFPDDLDILEDDDSDDESEEWLSAER